MMGKRLEVEGEYRCDMIWWCYTQANGCGKGAMETQQTDIQHLLLVLHSRRLEEKKNMQ